ncbi:MAG: hypothetical protein WAP03_27570 [Methylorubrum rhodinum]|uniref:hypothetical protein n=1 Tax=Methylorubrum rhodinum TaxID=29428 RepID=UPI003BAE378E
MPPHLSRSVAAGFVFALLLPSLSLAEAGTPWTASPHVGPRTTIAVRALDGSAAALQTSATAWLAAQGSGAKACRIAGTVPRLAVTCPGRQGPLTYTVTIRCNGGWLVTGYSDQRGRHHTGTRLLDRFSADLEGYERP